MNTMRNLPVPGEFYRHFKNRFYQIIALAFDSETSEQMVVYQALYGDFRIWVRPLAMFMEEVDRSKYPDAPQKFRFEKVNMGNHTNDMPMETQNAWSENGGTAEAPRPMSQHLLEFFDAMDEKNYDQMLEALAKLSRDATQKEIDDICLVMDMTTVGVSVDEQIAEIRRQIHMLKKFDGVRLR